MYFKKDFEMCKVHGHKNTQPVFTSLPREFTESSLCSAFDALSFKIMTDARGRTRNTRQQMQNVPRNDKELLLHCLSRLHPWPMSTLFSPPSCCQSVSFRPSLARVTNAEDRHVQVTIVTRT